jgi:hypothetical protein
LRWTDALLARHPDVERHLNLLSILWNLWGALVALVGTSLLLLAAGALAWVLGPDRATGAFGAGLFAAVFALTGGFAVLWGGAHVWAGVLVKRRMPFGRMLSLGLGVANLLILPFGTALGIYALWVMLTGEGRKLFEPHTLPSPAPR